jgi:hypothetical protein
VCVPLVVAVSNTRFPFVAIVCRKSIEIYEKWESRETLSEHCFLINMARQNATSSLMYMCIQRAKNGKNHVVVICYEGISSYARERSFSCAFLPARQNAENAS